MEEYRPEALGGCREWDEAVTRGVVNTGAEETGMKETAVETTGVNAEAAAVGIGPTEVEMAVVTTLEKVAAGGGEEVLRKIDLGLVRGGSL